MPRPHSIAVEHPATASDGYVSVADETCVRMREHIIAGKYPPGYRFRERELSTSLGVSRIPVREALQQLEGEGLVTSRSRRGVVVRQLSLQDVSELFDLRVSLEVLAAKQAALCVAAGASCESLDALLAEAERVTQSADPTRIREVNITIHARIVDLSGNILLREVMGPLFGLIRWVFALTADRDSELACLEHQELGRAIRTGKPDVAAALALAHIEHGREPSLRSLEGVLPMH